MFEPYHRDDIARGLEGLIRRIAHPFWSAVGRQFAGRVP